jgi:hypothetical protein
MGLVLVIALLVLTPWAGASAQQLQIDQLGTAGLRIVLKKVFHLEPLHKISDLHDKEPKDTVVIVFGNLQCLDEVGGGRGGLKKFVNNGGALLIASDRPDNGRLAEFGVHIDGNLPVLPIPMAGFSKKFELPSVRLRGPDGIPFNVTKEQWEKGKDTIFKGCMPLLRAADSQRIGWRWIPQDLWEQRWAEPYKDFDDCPLVMGHLGSAHPLFANCRLGIASNRPSYIVRHPECECALLIGFPPFGEAITVEGSLIFDQAFAVGSNIKHRPEERLLIVSGHTPFTDGLLAQKDNDNEHFTVNTVRWLAEKPGAPGKKRKYVLFLHDNKVIDNFDVPLGMPPMPTTRIVNNLLRVLEEENFFNLLLLDILDRNDPARGKLKVLRALLVAAVVGLAFYGLTRYRRARHRLDVAVPLVEAKLAQTTAEFVPALVKRDKLALRGNDFRESARTLARLCFEQSPGGHRSSLPPRLASGVRDRAGLADAVDRLWDLAYGEADEPVSADALASLAALVQQVQDALANRTLQWVATS